MARKPVPKAQKRSRAVRLEPCELYLIVHNAALTVDIKEALFGAGIEGYTVVEGVHGQGRSGKRFGDDVFPGINHLLLVAVPPAASSRLRGRLTGISAAHPGAGLKILAVAAKDLL